jgi:hypothetical protein
MTCTSNFGNAGSAEKRIDLLKPNMSAHTPAARIGSILIVMTFLQKCGMRINFVAK